VSSAALAGTFLVLVVLVDKAAVAGIARACVVWSAAVAPTFLVFVVWSAAVDDTVRLSVVWSAAVTGVIVRVLVVADGLYPGVVACISFATPDVAELLT